MNLLRFLKNSLRQALPPVIFLAITAYFAWNAVHGSRGLRAQDAERAALVNAQVAFAAVDAQRAEWEIRVADLNSQSVAQDMLDEQARQTLDLAEPGEMEVLLSPASGRNK